MNGLGLDLQAYDQNVMKGIYGCLANQSGFTATHKGSTILRNSMSSETFKNALEYLKEDVADPNLEKYMRTYVPKVLKDMTPGYRPARDVNIIFFRFVWLYVQDTSSNNKRFSKTDFCSILSEKFSEIIADSIPNSEYFKGLFANYFTMDERRFLDRVTEEFIQDVWMPENLSAFVKNALSYATLHQAGLPEV